MSSLWEAKGEIAMLTERSKTAALWPLINKIIEKKNCAVNVVMQDGEIVVTVLKGNRRQVFKGTDSNTLISDLQHYTQSRVS